MKLVEWLSQTKIKINDLAHLLQVNRNHIYMIRRGIKKPSKRLIQKVYDMTLGHVNGIDDFRDEICLRHKVQKRNQGIIAGSPSGGMNLTEDRYKPISNSLLA